MRAAAFDRRVILRDVEINRPGPQRVGERFQRRLKHRVLLPFKILRQNAVFRRVVAHGVQQRMRHVGLKTDDLWAVRPLQQVNHMFPAVHAAPADFALRREALAKAFGDIAGLRKSRGDELAVANRIGGPVLHARA